MYYLLLGHVARLMHLTLPFTYSLFRILGGYLLLLSLHRFFEATIEDTRPRRVAFALAALGSGLGWTLVPLGEFTADFWVAETYPFLSIYNNPHFPLGLALSLIHILRISISICKTASALVAEGASQTVRWMCCVHFLPQF